MRVGPGPGSVDVEHPVGGMGLGGGLTDARHTPPAQLAGVGVRVEEAGDVAERVGEVADPGGREALRGIAAGFERAGARSFVAAQDTLAPAT